MKKTLFIAAFAVLLAPSAFSQERKIDDSSLLKLETKRDLGKEVEGMYIVKTYEDYDKGKTVQLPSNGLSMYYNVSRLDETTILITNGGKRLGKDFQNMFKAKLSLRNGLIVFDEIWEQGDAIASGKFDGERMEELNKWKSNNNPQSKSIAFR